MTQHNKQKLEKLAHNIDSLKQKHIDPSVAKADNHPTTLAYRLLVEIIAGIAVGGFLGWWLDKWLNTKPIFTLILLFLGMVSGLYNVIRTIKTIPDTK